MGQVPVSYDNNNNNPIYKALRPWLQRCWWQVSRGCYIMQFLTQLVYTLPLGYSQHYCAISNH